MCYISFSSFFLKNYVILSPLKRARIARSKRLEERMANETDSMGDGKVSLSQFVTD
jgi:hypothetical protein